MHADDRGAPGKQDFASGRVHATLHKQMHAPMQQWVQIALSQRCMPHWTNQCMHPCSNNYVSVMFAGIMPALAAALRVNKDISVLAVELLHMLLDLKLPACEVSISSLTS